MAFYFCSLKSMPINIFIYIYKFSWIKSFTSENNITQGRLCGQFPITACGTKELNGWNHNKTNQVINKFQRIKSVQEWTWTHTHTYTRDQKETLSPLSNTLMRFHSFPYQHTIPSHPFSRSLSLSRTHTHTHRRGRRKFKAFLSMRMARVALISLWLIWRCSV